MRKGNRIGTRSLAFIACAAALAAGAAVAGEQSLRISFAGTGFDTAVDTNYDMFPVQLSHAAMKGSFGAADLVITTEWEPGSVVCPAGYDLPLTLVNSALVITSPDQSQVFGFSEDAYMCVNTTNGLYLGEMSGIYNGGTGRYEGAGGEWKVTFTGATLDPPIGFRSVLGEGMGRLVLP